MGLLDRIRGVIGGGDDGTAPAEDAPTQPDLVDTHELDVSTLRERAGGVAEEVSVLDFSLDSLEQFDDAIDAGYDEPLPTADGPGTYATDAVRFGCYLGEVLVRVYDGEWTRNPDWGVTVAGPDGTTTVAVFDVAERSITTGVVFAAVADRAAVEIGLDGVPADSGDPGSSGDAPATPVDEESETAAGDNPPIVEQSSDDPLTTATPEAVADETTALPDSGAADTAPSEADRETAGDADTASLIEEAEPETVADDSGAQSGTSEEVPPSLFGDASAGTGPTVADAPAADDGPFAGSGPGSADVPADADRETATPDDTASVTEADSGAAPADDPETDPTDGDDLRATYAEAADDLASFWTEYDLDYTPDSLARLDALVGAEWDDDRFDDAEFGGDDTFDDRVFTGVSTELGSYFGEVLVRELDAEWSDETTTDGVVAGADGALAVPVFNVAASALTQQPVFARSYASLRTALESDGEALSDGPL